MNDLIKEAEEEVFFLGLCLYGDHISIDGVSKLFGLTPTRFRNKGDKRVTSTGTELVQEIGMWEHWIKVVDDDISKILFDVLRGVKGSKCVGQFGIEQAEVDLLYLAEFYEEPKAFRFKIKSDVLERISDLGMDLIITAR